MNSEAMGRGPAIFRVFAGAMMGLLLLSPPSFASSDADDATERAIRTLMQQDVATFDSPIDVHVKDAVVRLAGTVADAAARNRAAAIAQRIRGVRAVVNDINVRLPLRTDGQITRNVNQALENALASDAGALTVSVEGGVVAVAGSVTSASALRRTLRVIQSVPGVRRIDSDVRVQTSEALTDAQIRAAVESRLRWDIWVHDEDVDVAVREGEIRLTGVVPGPWVEQRVAELASVVRGVTSVDTAGLSVDPDLHGARIRSRPFQPSDSEIAQAIKSAFRTEPGLDDGSVVPSVSDGEVLLAGRVPTRALSQRAFNIARDTVGVNALQTVIEVLPENPPSDSELVASVSIALANNPALADKSIGVSARSGVVTLAGRVPETAYRLRAERIAGDVIGVTRVINLVRVLNRSGLDIDRELAEDIETALFWNPYVDEDAVSVMVSDGVAELRGRVKTLRALHAAADTAREAGAARVENLITVGF